MPDLHSASWVLNSQPLTPTAQCDHVELHGEAVQAGMNYEVASYMVLTNTLLFKVLEFEIDYSKHEKLIFENAIIPIAIVYMRIEFTILPKIFFCDKILKVTTLYHGVKIHSVTLYLSKHAKSINMNIRQVFINSFNNDNGLRFP